MKKLLTIFCFAFAFFLTEKASAQAEIDKGNVLLNAGFGVGYYYAGGIPIVLSAEFAINESISVGPYLGITSYTDRYRIFGDTYKYRYTFIDFGVRGSYHFSQHINMNTDKLDLYGGALLGYVTASYSGDDDFGSYDAYDGRVQVGIFGGARWYFTERFAANGEVGFGIAPLQLGVSFKL